MSLCKMIKLYTPDRSNMQKFPVFKESEIFNKDSEIFESICDMDQDDDIETDEEVLAAGIQQCHQDLRDLKNFTRSHKSFRAQTKVVHIWRKKGFWFSQDGRQANCTMNFDCKNIF